MKKIIIVGGSLQSSNRGINALTKGAILLILDKYGIKSEIKLINVGKRNKVHRFFYKGEKILLKEISYSRKQIIESYIKSITLGKTLLLEEIRDTDYVWDVSKGDNFNCVKGLKQFVRESLLKKIVINCKVPLILMPQSIGPFNNFITRKVAKGIVEKSDKVFVRDICSKDLLKIDLKIKKDINVVTDLSFYMYRDENISMDRFIDGGKKVIGININAALYNKDDEDFRYSYAKIIEKVIRKFAITEEAEILLVPHVDSVDNCDEDDFKVCRELAYNMSKSIGKNIKSIGFDYSSEEIKGIISKCEFFIGSRLYPCIDSISSKVPTIFLAYNSNYVDMFNYFNLNEFVYDISDGIGDNLLDEIINRYKEKNKMIDKLTNIVPELKKQLVSIS